MFTSYNSLYRVPDNIETRWASAENWKGEKGQGGLTNGGRKGSAWFDLKAGQNKVLAEVNNSSGMVRRMWATLANRSPKILRGLKLDIFWDGALTPAVSAPWGDFFGVGLGRLAPFESALFSNPEGRSFNCYVPMPFNTGMEIILTNETDIDSGPIFYKIDYTVGDHHDDDTLYFHAHWRRQRETVMKQDYEILPTVNGKGRYLGASISVIPNQELYCRSWWGEGEVKIFLDGDTAYPTLCGTGTEDYPGSGWGIGPFSNRYQGCPIADDQKFQFSFYRFHLPDPVYFHRDVRVVMQQIGCWMPDSIQQMYAAGRQLIRAGEGCVPVDMAKAAQEKGFGLFEIEKDDWSSCAYFYFDKPVNNLPILSPVEERIGGLA